MGPPCIFLDRDGTLIVERHYLGDPDGVELEQGVIAGLRRLAAAGYAFVVVTNQSGVARGLLSAAQVDSVNARTAELLAAEGIAVLDWYVCPHAPEDFCDCRKPRTGLIERAMREHSLDLRGSIVVGDKDIDLMLAKAMDIEGYLVLTGHGAEHADWARRHGFPVSPDLADVATRLLPAGRDIAHHKPADRR